MRNHPINKLDLLVSILLFVLLPSILTLHFLYK